VAVSNSAGTVEVIDRRRVAITSPGTPGANQPYHFAENLELPEAEKFLGNCFAASKRLAMAAVRDVVGELHGRQYRVVGSAVLLASGRPLPPLSKILASHALIHAAEGEFFREAFSKACESLGSRSDYYGSHNERNENFSFRELRTLFRGRYPGGAGFRVTLQSL
jgi:hypothetical protein